MDRQRPIALQQARLKWLTGVLLLQLQDALFLLVPSQQKAYLRGRTMFDHLASSVRMPELFCALQRVLR